MTRTGQGRRPPAVPVDEMTQTSLRLGVRSLERWKRLSDNTHLTFGESLRELLKRGEWAVTLHELVRRKEFEHQADIAEALTLLKGEMELRSKTNKFVVKMLTRRKPTEEKVAR